MLYESERKRLAQVIKIMYDRFGTNAAGGNVSWRLNDNHLIMSPTLMSQDYNCDLSPYQILVVDMDENIIEGDGNLTREINMHLACYRTNRKIGSVVHAHAKESMVFATIGLAMPNLTEATKKFGEIPVLPFHPATSRDLAEEVKEHVKGLGEDVVSKAILLDSHGVLVLDKTLNKAYDDLERLEWNAYIAYKSLIYDHLGIHSLRDKQAFEFNVEE